MRSIPLFKTANDSFGINVAKSSSSDCRRGLCFGSDISHRLINLPHPASATPPSSHPSCCPHSHQGSLCPHAVVTVMFPQPHAAEKKLWAKYISFSLVQRSFYRLRDPFLVFVCVLLQFSSVSAPGLDQGFNLSLVSPKQQIVSSFDVFTCISYICFVMPGEHGVILFVCVHTGVSQVMFGALIWRVQLHRQAAIMILCSRVTVIPRRYRALTYSGYKKSTHFHWYYRVLCKHLVLFQQYSAFHTWTLQ